MWLCEEDVDSFLWLKMNDVFMANLVVGLKTQHLNLVNKELQGRNRPAGYLDKKCIFQNKLILFCNANPSNASSKMPNLLSLPTYSTTRHPIQITRVMTGILRDAQKRIVLFLYLSVCITLKSDRQTYSYTIFFKLVSKAAILASVFSTS